MTTQKKPVTGIIAAILFFIAAAYDLFCDIRNLVSAIKYNYDPSFSMIFSYGLSFICAGVLVLFAFGALKNRRLFFLIGGILGAVLCMFQLVSVIISLISGYSNFKHFVPALFTSLNIAAYIFILLFGAFKRRRNSFIFVALGILFINKLLYWVAFCIVYEMSGFLGTYLRQLLFFIPDIAAYILVGCTRETGMQPAPVNGFAPAPGAAPAFQSDSAAPNFAPAPVAQNNMQQPPASPAPNQGFAPSPDFGQPPMPPVPDQNFTPAAAPQADASRFKFCTECGTKIPADAVYCTLCGKKLM